MVYFVKMMAKFGMTRKDVDFLYAGATAARFAALQSGASSAAMITAPPLFTAEAVGFVNLGYVPDFAPDIPFCAELVNRSWATAHKATVKKFIAAYSKAIAWFYDTKNRDEAIDHPGRRDQDEQGRHRQFVRSVPQAPTISRSRIPGVAREARQAYYAAQKELDPTLNLDVSKLVMSLD